MPDIQREDAKRLLSILANLKGAITTYGEAAKAIGRNRNNARTVAQSCSLLDAAAVMAGQPLLALTRIREGSGNINDNAWRKVVSGRVRETIINVSKNHRFTRNDFTAIRNALERLPHASTPKVWQWVINQKQYKDYCRRHSNVPVSFARDDAINDMGNEEPVPMVFTGKRYPRNQRVRDAVLRRAKGKCEYCGERGFICENGRPYLESHHIIALASQGPDKMTNVIALCPSDHREAHYGRQRQKVEGRMVRIVRQKEGTRRR